VPLVALNATGVSGTVPDPDDVRTVGVVRHVRVTFDVPKGRIGLGTR
jgi:hypothetical protein